MKKTKYIKTIILFTALPLFLISQNSSPKFDRTVLKGIKGRISNSIVVQKNIRDHDPVKYFKSVREGFKMPSDHIKEIMHAEKQYTESMIDIAYTETSSANNFLFEESLGEIYNGDKWQKDYRYKRIYDTSENLIEDTYKSWTNDKVVYLEKISLTYDKNNNITEYIAQWNEPDAPDLNRDRWIYIYDDDNHMIETVYQHWRENNWLSESKTLYSYENNNLGEILNQDWDGNDWINDWKDSYIFDENNNRIAEFYQQWEDNQWVDVDRSTHSYDGNNNRVAGFGEKWDGNAWITAWKDSCSYDSNNNQIAFLFSRWNGEEWVNV